MGSRAVKVAADRLEKLNQTLQPFVDRFSKQDLDVPIGLLVVGNNEK